MGAKTKYVERSIRDLIQSGELGPRERLPSQRQLAEHLLFCGRAWEGR